MFGMNKIIKRYKKIKRSLDSRHKRSRFILEPGESLDFTPLTPIIGSITIDVIEDTNGARAIRITGPRKSRIL